MLTDFIVLCATLSNNTLIDSLGIKFWTMVERKIGRLMTKLLSLSITRDCSHRVAGSYITGSNGKWIAIWRSDRLHISWSRKDVGVSVQVILGPKNLQGCWLSRVNMYINHSQPSTSYDYGVLASHQSKQPSHDGILLWAACHGRWKTCRTLEQQAGTFTNEANLSYMLSSGLIVSI